MGDVIFDASESGDDDEDEDRSMTEELEERRSNPECDCCGEEMDEAPESVGADWLCHNDGCEGSKTEEEVKESEDDDTQLPWCPRCEAYCPESEDGKCPEGHDMMDSRPEEDDEEENQEDEQDNGGEDNMPEDQNKGSDQESDKPFREYESDAAPLNLVVWRNENENGFSYSFQLRRYYTQDDGDSWEETPNLNARNVPHAVELYQRAYQDLILSSEDPRSED